MLNRRGRAKPGGARRCARRVRHAPNAARAAELGVRLPTLGKPSDRAVSRAAKALALRVMSCGCICIESQA